MADKKISQLTALSAANLAPSTDVLAIVDTSATETKKIVAQDLVNGVLNVASAVGIGTSSPTEKLTVAGNIKLGTTGTTYLYGPSTTGRSFISNSDSSAYIGLYGSAYGSGLDSILSFVAGTTNTMTFNASGNLGLGVTPSAWNSAWRALEIGRAGNALTNNAVNGAGITSNAVLDSVGWKFGGTGYANFMAVGNGGGSFAWYTSTASGTAGNTITFTQAMTLDASGNLGVGTTSPAFRLDLKGSGATAFAQMQDSTAVYKAIYGVDSGGGVAGAVAGALTNHPFILRTNNTERARITSGGDFLTAGKTSASFTTVGAELLANGQINTATANLDNLNIYNTTAAAYRFYVSAAGTVFATNTTISAISDQRFKENVQDLDVGLNAVMALKPRKFDWKAGKGKDIKGDRGFIAQEFEQVFPELIDEWKDPAPEGEEPYKAVRADLIPVLVKAIQEQQAMIETLKAKVAALEAK